MKVKLALISALLKHVPVLGNTFKYFCCLFRHCLCTIHNYFSAICKKLKVELHLKICINVYRCASWKEENPLWNYLFYFNFMVFLVNGKRQRMSYDCFLFAHDSGEECLSRFAVRNQKPTHNWRSCCKEGSEKKHLQNADGNLQTASA